MRCDSITSIERKQKKTLVLWKYKNRLINNLWNRPNNQFGENGKTIARAVNHTMIGYLCCALHTWCENPIGNYISCRSSGTILREMRIIFNLPSSERCNVISYDHYIYSEKTWIEGTEMIVIPSPLSPYQTERFAYVLICLWQFCSFNYTVNLSGAFVPGDKPSWSRKDLDFIQLFFISLAELYFNMFNRNSIWYIYRMEYRIRFVIVPYHISPLAGVLLENDVYVTVTFSVDRYRNSGHGHDGWALCFMVTVITKYCII